MAHSQLTLAQRYIIFAYLQAGISKRQMAIFLNVHHSTIFREIARNSTNGKYDPEAAEKQSQVRRKQAKKRRKISPHIWELVEKLLRLDFSPEQIAGVLNISGNKLISHETIYQYVLADKANAGTLWKHLRWSHKKKRKRYGTHDRRGVIPDRVSIDERPAIVDKKERVGDWEIDTAIGKKHQGAIIVAVDRKTKLTILGHSPYKRAELVSREIIRMLKPFKTDVLTITVDNGKEFAQHKTIAKQLEADVYFAHPYSAWERGLNENTVGLVRQYFPKNMSLRNVDPEKLQAAQNRLNIRPRKTLGFLSPIQVFLNAVAFET
ncbi:MAG: IS30 family transposase [Desulfobacterales bacterium]|nr:IS30 family transposase [Desulfobacterales bacterium]